MHRWLLPPLPQRASTEPSLLAAQSRSARDTGRLSGEAPFALPLFAAVSHLGAQHKRREGKKEKKQTRLLPLNNLSITTKPERQPRAGSLFCLMLTVPWAGRCRSVGAGQGARHSTGREEPGPAQPHGSSSGAGVDRGSPHTRPFC